MVICVLIVLSFEPLRVQLFFKYRILKKQDSVEERQAIMLKICFTTRKLELSNVNMSVISNKLLWSLQYVCLRLSWDCESFSLHCQGRWWHNNNEYYMVCFQVISLRENKIKVAHNPGVSKDLELYLYGNPLTCDCHLKYVKYMTFVDMGDMPCAEPLGLAGRNWTDISEEDLTCDGLWKYLWIFHTSTAII